jgi:radical SAM protein with 4Fe4S-binding SPASM domain
MKKFEGFPLIIGWELTLRCNLRCLHCGSSAGYPRESELTTGEALAICEQFPGLLVQEVDFTGGEPLLRPDLPVIASKLKDLGISTCILTHGIGYTADNIAQLKDMGISGVGISLDGLEHTHDYIRRTKGAYGSVMKTIKLLQDADLPFNVISTVHSRNVGELQAMYEHLQAAHVHAWRLQVVIPNGRAKKMPELQITEKDLLLLGLFIQQNKKNGSPDSLKIVCGDGLQYIIPTLRPWKGCAAGIVSCGITADGKVKGCLSMSDELIEGDLRLNSLWDVWFHPDAFHYNRAFQSGDLGAFCSLCQKGNICKGGCSSSSYAITGLFHNDPNCFHRVNGNCSDVT